MSTVYPVDGFSQVALTQVLHVVKEEILYYRLVQQPDKIVVR